MSLKTPKSTEVAATVTKFYGDVVAQETLTIHGAVGSVTVAGAGEKFICSDEDGNYPFLAIGLDAVGSFSFEFPSDAPVHLLQGKDIKLTVSGGSTGRMSIDFRTRYVTSRTE